MRIRVRAVNLALDARTRAEIELLLQASLGRLERRILRVDARVADQNGPRGGADISCLVEVRLRPRGRLFVEETDVDLQGAVRRAADAAATTVSRNLERKRDLHRRPSTRPALDASGI
ncbi:MAG: HPF/RaiA family ribosome-associated protein [Spirochaetia bacterium]